MEHSSLQMLDLLEDNMHIISVASKRMVYCHMISNNFLPSTVHITKEILQYCSNVREEYGLIWMEEKGRRQKCH